MKTDLKRGGGTIDALALRCSPSVLRANPAIFGVKITTSAEHVQEVAHSGHEAAKWADFARRELGEPWNDAPGRIVHLELPGYCPRGINSLKGRHWGAVAKAKREAKMALARSLASAGILHPNKAAKGTRWHLHIVRHGAGILDGDNLTGAFKQLQDALVNTGLIPGDDWHTLRATHDQKRVKRGQERTIVTIWQVARHAPSSTALTG